MFIGLLCHLAHFGSKLSGCENVIVLPFEVDLVALDMTDFRIEDSLQVYVILEHLILEDLKLELVFFLNNLTIKFLNKLPFFQSILIISPIGILWQPLIKNSLLLLVQLFHLLNEILETYHQRKDQNYANSQRSIEGNHILFVLGRCQIDS